MAEAQPPQDDPAAAGAAPEAATPNPAPDATTNPATDPNVAAAAAAPPSQPGAVDPAAAPAAPAAAAGGAAEMSTEQALDQFSIDELLKQASFDDPTKLPDGQGMDAAAAAAMAAAEFRLPSFQQVMQDAQVSSIDLLRDVELNVKIELGRSRMMVEDVLKLAEGSVVELDKLAGDPVDVFVNDRLVARGEVLVLNDNFCVRVNEIVAAAKEEAL
jgi:flagellar motor switch protein FliN/FliY